MIGLQIIGIYNEFYPAARDRLLFSYDSFLESCGADGSHDLPHDRGRATRSKAQRRVLQEEGLPKKAANGNTMVNLGPKDLSEIFHSTVLYFNEI